MCMSPTDAVIETDVTFPKGFALLLAHLEVGPSFRSSVKFTFLTGDTAIYCAAEGDHRL
jgi:hypothetical protein